MRYRNSKLWNRNSNFLTLQTLEFKKYFPTGIFGIKNGIWILLTMGVPEIGTKNWNSHSRIKSAVCLCLLICHFFGVLIDRFGFLRISVVVPFCVPDLHEICLLVCHLFFLRDFCVMMMPKSVSSNNKFQQTPDILSHLTSPHNITASISHRILHPSLIIVYLHLFREFTRGG